MASEERKPAPRYIAINRTQHVLQRLEVDRLIDDDHAARKIWRVVEQLDLSRFQSETLAVEGAAGRPSHSPQVLVAVWLYAYSKGLHSAREIERQMGHEPGLEWLTGLGAINHHTLSDFRVGYGAALQELFEQVLAMLTMKGLIRLERVAVDGTKIRADVNKKSFRRCGKIEAHLELARGHLHELAKQEREEQTTKREAAARQRAAREQEQRLEEALVEIERLRAAKKNDKRKEPQASTTDADASFMWMHDGGVAPAYNVQITADSAHGLIADVAVVNDPQDGQQIAPAMDRLLKRNGRYPPQCLADGGYTNNAAVLAMDERSIDYYSTWTGRNEGFAGRAARRHEDYLLDRFGYDEQTNEMICPEGKRLRYRQSRRTAGGEVYVYEANAEDCGACPARERCCPDRKLDRGGRTASVQIYDAAIERFDEKMKQPEALALYKQRAPLVEFPNAWIKQKLKLRRFATRGLSKVRCEALWAGMTFNLQRMFRLAPA